MLYIPHCFPMFMSISKDDRVILNPDDIPTKWYNIAADLPEPLPPPLNPATNQPMKPEDLEAIFPKRAIAQEMSVDRYIDIPEEVRDAYLMLGRPSPSKERRGLRNSSRPLPRSTSRGRTCPRPVRTSPTPPYPRHT